jgi:hypothetical protein
VGADGAGLAGDERAFEVDAEDVAPERGVLFQGGRDQGEVPVQARFGVGDQRGQEGRGAARDERVSGVGETPLR